MRPDCDREVCQDEGCLEAKEGQHIDPAVNSRLSTRHGVGVGISPLDYFGLSHMLL